MNGPPYVNVKLNTDPPSIRCDMRKGRCRNDGPRWIRCRGTCSWSSQDHRRVGWRWRLSVWLGYRLPGALWRPR